ncbi:MAG: hypothetical protein AB1514_08155, partial [Pseudomonadota bacterium]
MARLGLKSYPDTDPAERQSCGSLKATPAPIKGMLKPASFAHENLKVLICHGFFSFSTCSMMRVA